MNKADEKKLVDLLSALKPGLLPLGVFVQIAKLVVLSIIEFVPLRLNENGQVEVLLLSRGDDDAIWPGVLHTPGTVLRPTDTQGKSYLAFERILKDELMGTESSSPHYVGSNLHRSKRGAEQAQIYWIEVLGPPKAGQFYEVDNLPSNLMESQKAFILLATRNYLETTS